jgi:hypothetical protein
MAESGRPDRDSWLGFVNWEQLKSADGNGSKKRMILCRPFIGRSWISWAKG